MMDISPPSDNDFSSPLKKRTKAAQVQTLQFGNRMNVFDIVPREDGEDTSKITVHDKTNIIQVQNTTTGIGFSLLTLG